MNQLWIIFLNMIDSTIHCKNCMALLAKFEIIRRTNRGIEIKKSVAISIECENNQSNIIKCNTCKSIIGHKNNDEYTLYAENFIKVSFELVEI